MKKYIGVDVLTAARQRISYIFDNFPRIYVSFSGGKDSTVMLHLAAEEAIKRKRRIGMLFIDLEGQYELTVNHIEEMLRLYEKCLDVYWVCLPIALRNAVSVYEPKWQCWDPDAKKIWIRQPPKCAIIDLQYFPFFRRGMEFEDFVPEFGKWFSQGERTACMIGIRTDESYNRYLKLVVRHNREFYKDKMWLLKQLKTEQEIYSAHPIYDWRTEDIWTYHAVAKLPHNRLYDLMHKAGLSIHQQRICQPYGDDQRKGLWLFHIIEPATWSKVVARVSGANSGSEFVQVNGNISGQIKISKPDGHTWESFSRLLLESMPANMKEHYANKIHRFVEWYKLNGWINEKGNKTFEFPDEAPHDLEITKKAPSWRRVAKMLLRNDYWAKTIGFVQNKDGFFYQNYMARVKKEREARRRANLQKHGRFWWL